MCAEQAVSDFLFSEDQLQRTPSRGDGVSEEAEAINRVYACELIADANLLLELPQVACARASVLFHRFFQRRSMVAFSVEDISMGALFLSAKLEEEPRSYRAFLNVFYRLEQRKIASASGNADPSEPPPLLMYSDEWYDLRARLLKAERFILREVGFATHVEHPHKFIGLYLHALQARCLAQRAWNYLNDSLRTILCLRYHPHVIACGAIYMASRVQNHQLPENPAWWLLFDATFEEIEDVCLTILQLYKMPKAHFVDVTPSEREKSAPPLAASAAELPQERTEEHVQARHEPQPLPAAAAEEREQSTQEEAKAGSLHSREEELRQQAMESVRRRRAAQEGERARRPPQSGESPRKKRHHGGEDGGQRHRSQGSRSSSSGGRRRDKDRDRSRSRDRNRGGRDRDRDHGGGDRDRRRSSRERSGDSHDRRRRR